MNNTCEPCGGAGEVCCNQIKGGEYCNGIYGCQPGDGPGTCTKECGAVGNACCDGDCDLGSTCNVDDVCEAIGGTSDPCFDGDTPFTFAIVSVDCGTPYLVSPTFMTNSLEDAEACLQQLFPPPPESEVCPANTLPDEAHVCKNGESFGYYFNHCSTQHLEACEAMFCGDSDGCSWAECE